jgi:hypothetical protein
LDGGVGHDRDATYSVAADLALLVGDEETRDAGVVYVSQLPDGPPVVLRDSGAVVWEVARHGGTMDEIVAGVAARTGLPTATIEADVQDFVNELTVLGLLVASRGGEDG